MVIKFNISTLAQTFNQNENILGCKTTKNRANCKITKIAITTNIRTIN